MHGVARNAAAGFWRRWSGDGSRVRLLSARNVVPPAFTTWRRSPKSAVRSLRTAKFAHQACLKVPMKLVVWRSARKSDKTAGSVRPRILWLSKEPIGTLSPAAFASPGPGPLLLVVARPSREPAPFQASYTQIFGAAQHGPGPDPADRRPDPDLAHDVQAEAGRAGAVAAGPGERRVRRRCPAPRQESR